MPKIQDSNDKVALITGAARRVGAEIARSLHSVGMKVLLHYRHSEKEARHLEKTLNQLRPGSALALQADLKDPETPRFLIDASLRAFGRLDVLVNNASAFYRSVMGEMTEDQFQDLMAANVKAPLFLAQAASKALALQSGCIINIADIHGERPMKDYLIYCISKSALIMLGKGLAKELGPNVRVNTISPGPIIWPEGENTVSDSMKTSLIEKTILKQEGHPENIAKAVLYLCQDASFMTGQVLVIDGGRSLAL